MNHRTEIEGDGSPLGHLADPEKAAISAGPPPASFIPLGLAVRAVVLRLSNGLPRVNCSGPGLGGGDNRGQP